MRNLILVFVSLIASNIYSQGLGSTKEEIINEYGYSPILYDKDGAEYMEHYNNRAKFSTSHHINKEGRCWLVLMITHDIHSATMFIKEANKNPEYVKTTENEWVNNIFSNCPTTIEYKKRKGVFTFGFTSNCIKP